jgi:hypothetical protein
MSENEWVTLMQVFDRLDGEIIKEALEAQGIPSQLFQEGVSHYIYPGSAPMGRIEVCVPSERLVEATAWLEAYNNGEFNEDGNTESDENNPELPDGV